MDAESGHEVLTSLSDTNVELHAAEEAHYFQMLEGRKLAGELVARSRSCAPRGSGFGTSC